MAKSQVQSAGGETTTKGKSSKDKSKKSHSKSKRKSEDDTTTAITTTTAIETTLAEKSTTITTTNTTSPPPTKRLKPSTSIDEDAPLSKHPSILKKFQTLLRTKSQITTTSADATITDSPSPPPSPSLAPQGLHPLPQPRPSKGLQSHIPLSSSLPPWLASPTTVAPSHTIPFSSLPLPAKLQSRLSSHLKLTHAFAVQAALIPLLLQPPNSTTTTTATPTPPPSKQPHDILISAPTGSGKTLAYILPLIANLSPRTVLRLRALIIVPTRELVTQVHATAESLASGLRIGIAWGARAIDIERSLLVKDNWSSNGLSASTTQSDNNNNNNNNIINDDSSSSSRPDDFDLLEAQGAECPRGRYTSNYDILICTPGRLVEHITTTPGFSHLLSESLEYCVVDEADRLLSQSFQEWVDVLLKALDGGTAAGAGDPYSAALGIREVAGAGARHPRKVILSATMTKDAGKLAGLRLRRPGMVVVESAQMEVEMQDAEGEYYPTAAADEADLDPDLDHQDVDAAAADDDAPPDETFAVPETLVEHYVKVSIPEDKPLYLTKLLALHDSSTNTTTDTDTDTQTHTPPAQRTLIFTKSNESAARLARLLELILGSTTVGLVTGELNKSSRKKTLAAFSRQEVTILVCSDLISRGLDFPAIAHVINYDIPATLRNYVHRVGRTARAGNVGHAWSLVAENEARWFWRNVGRGVKRASGVVVRREGGVVVGDAEEVVVGGEGDESGDGELRRRYERALETLGGEVKSGGRRGRRGEDGGRD